MAVCLGGIIVGLALMFTEEKFFEVAAAVVAAHLPVMIIEGIVTALCVAFLKKVLPSILPGCTPKEVS
jgi:cobalt/nickel transport system permease protein